MIKTVSADPAATQSQRLVRTGTTTGGAGVLKLDDEGGKAVAATASCE